MKFALVIVFFSLALHSWSADDVAAPFTLTVVPSFSLDKVKRIIISGDQAEDFYVVLTNISKEPQSVFEYWNSWGYNAISFEFTLPDGKKSTAFVAVGKWGLNYPSIFTIPPGEQQVYPIHLDNKWAGLSEFNANRGADVQIKRKAIYHVGKTPESTEKIVWIGRVESKIYDLTTSRGRK